MRTITIIACIALLALSVACAPARDGTNGTGAPGMQEGPAAAPGLAPETPAAQEAPLATGDTVATPAAEPDAKFTVTGVEGDLVRLNPRAIDPDEDSITYSFGAPFNANGEWQTQVGDEGTSYVAVSATDAKGARTSETVKVVIARADRPPTIECGAIVVNEGDVVDLHQGCAISDEDNEEVAVTYGGWMDSSRYQATYDDAGTHTVLISASDKRDGKIIHTVRQNVTVTVKNVNRAPVFSADFPTSIKATEGDVITLPRDLISDPDKDKVSVTFSEPLDASGVWKTKLGDAGAYDIDVVASDGMTTAKRTVHVEISLRNTAPTLKPIPDIAVDEGQTVTLPISATDREGDPLDVKVSGWMDSPTRKTTYDDAGNYTVKVSVSDGTFTADQVVRVTVRDVNRPPVFVTPA